jgi:hypothetical protein
MLSLAQLRSGQPVPLAAANNCQFLDRQDDLPIMLQMTPMILIKTPPPTPRQQCWR